MKSVLISIQPKWCELIASGKKTVEVRKTRPKLETPFKCYIYCTKSKSYFAGKHPSIDKAFGGGMVIGEFVCDDIGEFKVFENGSVQYWNYHELGKTCLTYDELANYIGRNKDGYGWHISNLVIYDKPRELSEFKKSGFMTEENWLAALYPNTHCHYEAWAKKFEITRPPQSWCFIESGVEDNA